MAGLLYKDFLAIKGKKIVILFLTATVIFLILKFIRIHMGVIDSLTAVNDKGEPVYIPDTFCWMLICCFNIWGVTLISGWRIRIMEYDEKNRVWDYISSMPFEKKTYVASKYVFTGICIYVFFSLYMVWNIIAMAFLEGGYTEDMLMFTTPFALELYCFSLLMSSIELPLLFAFGKGKAMLFKIGFSLMCGMLVLGYLFFGDLNVFSNWDVETFMSWADKHAFALTSVSILSPLITILIYFVSYRISVLIFERREGDYE